MHDKSILKYLLNAAQFVSEEEVSNALVNVSSEIKQVLIAKDAEKLRNMINVNGADCNLFLNIYTVDLAEAHE